MAKGSRQGRRRRGQETRRRYPTRSTRTYARVLDDLTAPIDPKKPNGPKRKLTEKCKKVWIAFQELSQRRSSVVSWYGFTVIQRTARYVAKVAGCGLRTVFRSLNTLESIDLLHRRQVTEFRGRETVRSYSAKRKRNYPDTGGYIEVELPRGPRRGPSMIGITEHAHEITGCLDPVTPRRSSDARPTPRVSIGEQLALGDTVREHAERMFDLRLQDAPTIFNKLDREQWIQTWIEQRRGSLYSVAVLGQVHARAGPAVAEQGEQTQPTVH